MELTAAAAWLNTSFAAFDGALLGFQHLLAEKLGTVLTPLMRLITLLGEKGLLLILLSLVLMLFARTRRIGVCMFGAIACGAIITNFILKDWVARPRPFETLELYRQYWQAIGAPAEDGFSFPSGHVTAATAGLTGLCLIDRRRRRRWIIPSVIWVLLMAVSRNYLMAHYPSDVLFAVLAGLVSALIAWAITRLLFRLLEEHDDLPFCAWVLDFDVRDLRPHYDEDALPDTGYKGKHTK
ncbi:MAG: phosphatase PAP2 family protein [Oscillospiraceae bacterium]|nr:phosphatase PAP2 family protein [Oscillospiraceae bacterium]